MMQAMMSEIWGAVGGWEVDGDGGDVRNSVAPWRRRRVSVESRLFLSVIIHAACMCHTHTCTHTNWFNANWNTFDEIYSILYKRIWWLILKSYLENHYVKGDKRHMLTQNRTVAPDRHVRAHLLVTGK